MGSSIQTTVDKLVSLINEYGKISLKDAAKKLALPISTIEDWSHILEDEGVVEIQYKLGSTLLVKRELTDQQVKQQVVQFREKKDLFNKKLESAESYFNELDKKIVSVVSLMKDLEGTFGKKLTSVNQELSNLQLAESRKEALDKQILESKRSSLQKLREVEEHIKNLKINYEASYAQARDELDKDQQLFEKSQKFLDRVKEQEMLLQQRLAEVKALSTTIQTDVEDRARKLAVTEDHVFEIKKKHDMLKDELENEHRALQDIIRENELQERQIMMLQKSIYEKIDKDERELTRKESEVREIPRRFKELFSHKQDISNLLNIISHEEVELRSEIENLKKQSKLLAMSTDSAEYAKELDRLHAQMDSITTKRTFFKKKIEQLSALLDLTMKKRGNEEEGKKAKGNG